MQHADHVAAAKRRPKILGLIRANPGITVDKLASKTGTNAGTMLLELDELENEGRIFTDTCPGCRRRRWMVR